MNLFLFETFEKLRFQLAVLFALLLIAAQRENSQHCLCVRACVYICVYIAAWSPWDVTQCAI